MEKLTNLLEAFPFAKGAIMAIAMTIIRLQMDNKRNGWKTDSLEVIACALIAFAASPLITWLGMQESVNIALGAAVGVVGSKQVRLLLLKFMGRRAEL